MSYTELYGLTETGASCIGETRNSWRGAMSVWVFLEKKYLPKYIPEWARDPEMGYSRTSAMVGTAIKEIWDLFKSPQLSESERIVLGSTFDKVLATVKNIDKVLKAFREFGGQTSLKEQADIIEKALKENPEVIAIGWNQTSVNGDTWARVHFDENNEEYSGYDLSKDNDHWFLIEEMEHQALNVK